MSLSMLTDGKTAQGDDESEDLLTTAQVLEPFPNPKPLAWKILRSTGGRMFS